MMYNIYKFQGEKSSVCNAVCNAVCFTLPNQRLAAPALQGVEVVGERIWPLGAKALAQNVQD